MNFKNFFNLKYLKGDIFGGVTAGIVALPLALAFGVQSGMGAIAGLYGAIALGIFAALLGGTPIQVSGPTGPMTVVSATVIASAIAQTGSLAAGLGVIIASFLLAGILQVVMGVIKLGRYIKYIPYSVISGFMTGIGVIIIILQLYPILGHSSSGKPIFEILANFDQVFQSIHWTSAALGALTIALIYTIPYLTKAVPSPLVALLLVSGIAYFAGADVAIIGDIPSGFPQLKIAEILNIRAEHYRIIVESGMILAALGAIDSLLTSMIADNITKTKHNSDQELIGQGIGNMASAIIAGLPGAGATMRTVVNVRSGGKTRLSGAIHGILLLVILLGLGRYAKFIPLSVLAGILITVGIGIIDYRGLRHLSKVPRGDAAVLIIVLLITVFGDLIQAVGIGLLLASVLFMKKSGDLAEKHTVHGSLSDFEGDVDEVFTIEQKDKIYVKKLHGPLFFGFTHYFQKLISDLDPSINILILRMEHVTYIDQTGAYALESSLEEMKKKNTAVFITGLGEQPREMLVNVHVIPDMIPEDHVFDKYEDCVNWIRRNHHEITTAAAAV